jgi:hypothetical protein
MASVHFISELIPELKIKAKVKDRITPYYVKTFLVVMPSCLGPGRHTRPLHATYRSFNSTIESDAHLRYEKASEPLFNRNFSIRK